MVGDWVIYITSVSQQRYKCVDACVPTHFGNVLFPVPGSCPQVLQLFLHLHLCAGIHPQTHRLRFSPLLQRQVQSVFVLCVGGVTLVWVPAAGAYPSSHWEAKHKLWWLR